MLSVCSFLLDLEKNSHLHSEERNPVRRRHTRPVCRVADRLGPAYLASHGFSSTLALGRKKDLIRLHTRCVSLCGAGSGGRARAGVWAWAWRVRIIQNAEQNAYVSCCHSTLFSTGHDMRRDAMSGMREWRARARASVATQKLWSVSVAIQHGSPSLFSFKTLLWLSPCRTRPPRAPRGATARPGHV